MYGQNTGLRSGWGDGLVSDMGGKLGVSRHTKLAR